PVKFDELRMDPAKDPSIGNSDMEPLWNRRPRAGQPLHWDGLNDSLTEVVLSGAVGDGATAKSLPVAYLKQMEKWLQDRQPPPYPYPIKWKLADQGKAIYQDKCANSHAFGGKETGTIIAIERVDTDAHRLDMWSQEPANGYTNYPSTPGSHFSHFSKHNGYVAVPLDGIWIRAPYLHNGSVPTMEDLLESQANRPKVFYRGYDVYARDKMGFISSGPEAQAAVFKYDTSIRGNGNGGHEGET